MSSVHANTLQDEHLDLMLRLAYRRAAGEEIRQLLDESSRPVTPEEEAQMQTGYALFLQKLAEQRSPEKPVRRRRRFSYLIEAAACIVLALGISMSVAVAKVEVIRSKVLELVIHLYEDHARVNFVPVGESAVEIPAGYPGEYFPTYIPEGYEFRWMSKYVPHVIYIREDDLDLVFEEVNEGTGIGVTAENASYYTVSVNGVSANVIDQPAYTRADGSYCERTITMHWIVGDRMIFMQYQGEMEELMKIAESVRKIIR